MGLVASPFGWAALCCTGHQQVIDVTDAESMPGTVPGHSSTVRAQRPDLADVSASTAGQCGARELSPSLFSSGSLEVFVLTAASERFPFVTKCAHGAEAP